MCSYSATHSYAHIHAVRHAIFEMIQMPICVCSRHAYVLTYLCLCVCVFVCVCLSVCVFVYMCACMCIFVQVACRSAEEIVKTNHCKIHKTSTRGDEEPCFNVGGGGGPTLPVHQVCLCVVCVCALLTSIILV